LVDPKTGDRSVDQVWFREEVYHGPYTGLAPDLLFVAQNYGCLGRELLGARRALESSMNWANGFHRMNGIFMAYGPRVQSGVRAEGATMVDVAPTLLYALGLAVPANMDGRVLTGVLSPGYTDANPVCYEQPMTDSERGRGSYSTEEQAEVSGRLAALGYIE
jgi:predicted AlkP superfamily phosphohydrolase/phosphomutase